MKPSSGKPQGLRPNFPQKPLFHVHHSTLRTEARICFRMWRSDPKNKDNYIIVSYKGNDTSFCVICPEEIKPMTLSEKGYNLLLHDVVKNSKGEWEFTGGTRSWSYDSPVTVWGVHFCEPEPDGPPKYRSTIRGFLNQVFDEHGRKISEEFFPDGLVPTGWEQYDSERDKWDIIDEPPPM